MNTFWAPEGERSDDVAKLLLRIFQGKLRGRALQAVSSNEDVVTWTALRTLLLQNFGDQRSEQCLFSDLAAMRPHKNEGPYDYGKRIKLALQLLLSNVKLNDAVANSRALKTVNYKNMALQIYLQGLLEIDNNIGIMVQVKQPADLEAAMNNVIEVENFNYRAGRSNNLQKVTMKTNVTNKNFVRPALPPRYPSSPMQRPIQQQPQQQTFAYQRPQFSNYQGPQFTNYQTRSPNYHLYPKPSPSAQRPQFAKSPGQVMERKPYQPMPMDLGSSQRRVSNNPNKTNWNSQQQQLYFQTTTEHDEAQNNEQFYEEFTQEHPEYLQEEPEQEHYEPQEEEPYEETNFYIVCLTEETP